MPAPAETLEAAIRRWVDDPESSVEYSELVDGRWASRMRQEVRDATTVWWELGQRTVRVEAYVAPSPPKGLEHVYRLCLQRNLGAYRTWFALDGEGAVVIRSRIAIEDLTPVVLDQVLGEIYEQIELTFPHLIRLGFSK